ncbi:aminoglycoside phosphotransferase family protein [Mycolicibacterium hodleri]|uniref:DUF1679 domain-containing protein n=1 Tax=Mycolicibacterium hodleri TaxID=49897 RepID=A0A502E6I8_9MYCO|nr:aminoglycoside phosphotransferase family protein [Mycolicibacterium hodleri]TPG32569.1 DUF1679 domain-containing protein [Mycolicibacterium hodleri]
MGTKIWLAGRASAVAGHILAEKFTRPIAHTTNDVPRDGLALSTRWLTEALCRDHPGAEVVSFYSPGGSVGTTTRIALRVRYNDVGRKAGLPTALFTKTSTNFAQRILMGAGAVLDGETQFFMNLRPHVEMEAPAGYWGGFDDASWRSIMVMEDVAETKGAQFLTATTAVTCEQMTDLVGNLAALHGAFWEHDVIRTLKTPREHLLNVSSLINMSARAKVGMDRSKSVIPSALHGQADRLWRGTQRCLEMATSALPATLLHGDCHIAQVYITRDGKMGLADWQVIQQGGWACDFAYLVASACEPQDRREWEEQLLRTYLEQLSAAGGKAPDFDQAWLAYRQQLFYPFSVWAFTLGRAFYQPKMQPDDVSLKVVHRLSTAIQDHNSFDAIGV